jgi:uncharacterized protein (DUF2147 family)
MRFDRIALHSVALAVAMASAAAARADNSATWVWIDHTGRGAVEITDCNGKLCGHVAWVDDAKNSDQCGKQIIGNVKSVGKNKWDNGWIYDPDRGSKYDVELTAVSADKLKVVGYAGTKWLSETYTWKRAPADLKKCNGDTAAAAPASNADDKPAVAAKKDDEKPAVAAKSEEPLKLDEAKSDTDKSEPAKAKTKSDTANAAPETSADEATETAKADNEDTNDEPKGRKKNGGKVLARLMDELGDGDGPVKIKRSGKTCKVTAPFVGVVSFPCDGDKD